MKILKVLYSIWSVWWLAVWFLVCYPILFIGALHPSLHALTHFGNRLWAVLVFGSNFLFLKVIGKQNKRTPAIYCANHASYMDIPTFFLTIPHFFMIIGKAELNKTPLFGFFFKRVYISVDRKNPKSRYQSYQQCLEAVERGRSVAFFPEGTIPRQGAPAMIKFKDGPFKTAIQKQVPIIPVTFPYNWKIAPGSGKSRWATLKRPIAIFHEPIQTTGMNIEEHLEGLKQQTFDLMDAELRKYNSVENVTLK